MKKPIVAASVAALAFGGLVAPSFAAPPGVETLDGSTFEIDTDANLTADNSGYVDWNTVTGAIVSPDEPSGSGDDSFGKGSKEDTAVPSPVTGSIPPNKSDLKEFGVYQEGTTTDGFLNLFWSRVQDPSGTTNMDFELNQKRVSEADSGNGVTPARTEDDLLITYDLSNGGRFATISIRHWTGSEWGTPSDITADGDAVGTINDTAITAANGGPYDPRTFGEAQVKLEALFGSNPGCTTFGSAYLKSRSSDSFTAALKDFIAPVDINLTNCGSITIVKQDDAGSALDGAVFTLFDGVTNTGLSCMTGATVSGTCTITNVPFGTYTVRETTTPPGYVTAADQSATISASTPTRTLTFVNPRQRGAIQVTKTYNGSTPQSGVTFTLSGNGLTTPLPSGATNSSGVVCFDNLLFGTYTVTETVPSNYEAAGDNPQTVTVDDAATCAGSPYAGETVAFDNTPLSKIAVGFAPQVAGATDATIECKKGETTLTGVSAFSLSGYTRAGGYIDLTPGTYVCTVVISTSSN